MNKEIIIMGWAIITFLFGIFMFACAICNPKKIIIGKLTESEIKNKEKFIYFNRVLYLFNGLIMVLIGVMLLLNIIDRSYISILYSIPALILVIGTSISKKYLVKKHRWIW
ncbi:hypothetical protein [Clostridium estertheticum]|uniref:hypothetical protein n=1 Tax=Clostridium estertheticum TaxID=238834 RepID=UPI001CF53118|nr:hypothetical protein [Clostridium estertheticum]MCB2357092.1 hypothetical protein [Clostridium estertheticum]WAG43781.1 hypothetical protein LL065_24195 [Clostridium estertheticum]